MPDTQKLDIIETQIAIARTLESEQSVAVGYVFGSFGTAGFNSESDIDIGILLDGEAEYLSFEAQLELKQKLEEAVGREVDLVLLGAASPILGMQVLRHGRKVFERDARPAEEFFVRTIERYADLKKVRREAEARVLEGKIYG